MHQKLLVLALPALIAGCGDDSSPAQQELGKCRTINSLNRSFCEERTVEQAISSPLDRKAFQPLDPIVLGFESSVIDYGDKLSFVNMTTDYVFLGSEKINPTGTQDLEGFGLYDTTRVKLRAYLTKPESTSVLWNQYNQLRVVVENTRKDDFRFSNSSVFFFSDTVFDQSNVGLMPWSPDQTAVAQTNGATKLTVWVSDSETAFVSNANAGVSLGVMDSINPNHP